LAALIKKLFLAFLLLQMASAPSFAAAFTVRRGINLDAWITWPPEKKWGDEAILRPFPEWRRGVHLADLKALKADGFDFVRMPVDPVVFLSPRTAGYRDGLYSDVLDAVRLVNQAGLKAIVDLHLMPGGSDRSAGMQSVMGDPQQFSAYLDVVRRMGLTLAEEDPHRVAFELMNEPVVDCETAAGRAAWSGKLKELFAAARASATRLTLVLTGGCWSSAKGLASVDPREIPDDNILWTFHSYDPFVLTHQSASWAGDFIPYVKGIPYPPYAHPKAFRAALAAIRARIRKDAPWARRAGLLSYLDEQVATVDTPEELKATMSRPFETVAKWADRNGIPHHDIFLGEFGMIRQEYGSSTIMPAAWRAAYVRDMTTLAERHGFGWSLWSYSGAFGVVETYDGKAAEPDVLNVIRALKPVH
jgi:hypothetical protein